MMLIEHVARRERIRLIYTSLHRHLHTGRHYANPKLGYPFIKSHSRELRHAYYPSKAVCFSNIQRRGAKVRSTLKLDELPQGSIPAGLEKRAKADDEPEYPTVVQQARNNMLKFSHCVVLTRVGGFYELYFEHAETYGPLLNLKVAKKKTSKGLVPMAGFPFYQLDRFLKILVQDMNKYVAISEEVPNDASKKIKSGGLLFDRKVTRIITPGTLIDEHFMNPMVNNYLLSIYVDPESLKLGGSSEISPIIEKPASVLNLPRVEVGLAWLDLSSGDFLTQSTDIASLPSAVARIGPREIILDSVFKDQEDSRLVSMLREDGHIIAFQEPLKRQLTVADWIPMLEDVIEDFDTTNFTAGEVAAGGSLLHYVKTQLQGSRARLQAPIRHQAEDFMSIDKNSLRALEIRKTIRDGRFEGSLLHTLKKTVTNSGTRLLSQRLCKFTLEELCRERSAPSTKNTDEQSAEPSMSLSVINDRLDLVEEMLEYPQLRQDLIVLLRRTFDTLRLVQRFSFGRGDADDLVGLSKTILTTSEIANLVDAHTSSRNAISANPDRAEMETRRRKCLPALIKRFSLEQPTKLANRIIEAIDEDGLSEQHRLEDDEAAEMIGLAQDVLGQEAGEEDLKQMPKRIQPNRNAILPSTKSATDGRDDIWIMKRSASRTLERLHNTLDSLTENKTKLEKDLREKLGTPSLTLKWTPNLGHIGHVKGKDVSRVTAHGIKSVSSSRTTRSLHVPDWSHLGSQLDETRHRIRTEEQSVLNDLRAQVIRNLVKLRRNAAVLDELDVACSFAILASEKGFVRPILNSGNSHNIVGGRHPVVEAGLGEQGRNFTSNDCFVGEKERIWLITGPNMAGKSTFLRQNALISILAQTGSFVPAEYAEIGIVDKVFSRVGSADNLYQDQSTFMVEMLETAQILKQATSRSFVIMDEVGRGTTPEDGVAVGYACLHHMYHTNQCRALFATHFHALADMTKDFEQLGCYCTDVAEESDGTFSYVHRLRKGVNRDSHALKVARVAGLPEEAIDVAAKVLANLKSSVPNPIQKT